MDTKKTVTLVTNLTVKSHRMSLSITSGSGSLIQLFQTNLIKSKTCRALEAQSEEQIGLVLHPEKQNTENLN